MMKLNNTLRSEHVFAQGNDSHFFLRIYQHLFDLFAARQYTHCMSITGERIKFDGSFIEPHGDYNLDWLNVARNAVARNVLLDPKGPEGLDGTLLTDEQAHIEIVLKIHERRIGVPLLGLVNHLRWMEWFWINHVVLKEPIDPATIVTGDEEFYPPNLTLRGALTNYRQQAKTTDEVISQGIIIPETVYETVHGPRLGAFILPHMVGETFQHAGHANIVREAIDGRKDEE